MFIFYHIFLCDLQNYSHFLRFLIILRLELEVVSWMITNWADFRSFFSHYDMTTVAALPYTVAIAREGFFNHFVNLMHICINYPPILYT